MHRQLLLITVTVTSTVCVLCAPTENPQEQNTVYDYSKFEEVYDQRQNGSENYKVDVDGVVVVWAAPESVLSAFTLLQPGLLDGDYSDLEEAWNQHKPQNLLEVTPDRPSSSTTTSLPPSLVTEGNAGQEAQNNAAKHENIKRKYRVPIFIRSFLGRRRA